MDNTYRQVSKIYIQQWIAPLFHATRTASVLTIKLAAPQVTESECRNDRYRNLDKHILLIDVNDLLLLLGNHRAW